jgi:hypothetical protein
MSGERFFGCCAVVQRRLYNLAGLHNRSRRTPAATNTRYGCTIATLLTPLHAKYRRPSFVATVFRNTPPPDGISSEESCWVLGSTLSCSVAACFEFVIREEPSGRRGTCFLAFQTLLEHTSAEPVSVYRQSVQCPDARPVSIRMTGTTSWGKLTVLNPSSCALNGRQSRDYINLEGRCPQLTGSPTIRLIIAFPPSV